MVRFRFAHFGRDGDKNEQKSHGPFPVCSFREMW
jgi:hypothetical protein